MYSVRQLKEYTVVAACTYAVRQPEEYAGMYSHVFSQTARRIFRRKYNLYIGSQTARKNMQACIQSDSWKNTKACAYSVRQPEAGMPFPLFLRRKGQRRNKD